MTRIWLKLASYQPKKHFAESKAVFLATPENFKVVGGVSYVNWAKCAENTRFPLASKCVIKNSCSVCFGLLLMPFRKKRCLKFQNSNRKLVKYLETFENSLFNSVFF